jgi:hypothetical protein
MSEIPEVERAAARMKSYTGSAILVFFLYWVFWLPGLIANYLFYTEAKKMQKVAGQSLPGMGCLSLMLWINVLAIVSGILLVFVSTIVSAF